MTELRRRMIQDMILAGFSEGTQRIYINAIRQLAGYYNTPPDRLTEKQVQDYMLYLRVEKKVAKGTFQSNFGAMKFLYLVTLDYSWPLFVKKSSFPASKAASRCTQ
ncbi:MAG: phage integrase N-terminal SAM-like domain-containing protein [Bacteroidetes bacterium]|nr:phage integrase N-terminal SAM-like domain-containing protein [Bacteroidota bacterium]